MQLHPLVEQRFQRIDIKDTNYMHAVAYLEQLMYSVDKFSGQLAFPISKVFTQLYIAYMEIPGLNYPLELSTSKILVWHREAPTIVYW